MRKYLVVILLALQGALPAEAKEVLAGPVAALLIEVKDGDTLRARATIWLGQDVEINVRIAGIDTPERGGRADCEKERRLAEEATTFLKSFVGEGPLVLTNIQYGKYAGRVVADVANENLKDAGAALIERGLARVYGGGKRERWCG